jgi:hypothetical protein
MPQIKNPNTIEEWTEYFQYESFKDFGFSDEQIASILKRSQ